MKKRICAVILSLLLAVNLAGVPKAKAVVSETALLGSIFGSLLVSLGYSWAAENMDVPTFGESIYKLIQEHDDANKDTGVQLLRDLNIAALTSGRPGTIQFNYAWTQAARTFAEWFQGKYFQNSNSASINTSTIDIGGISYTPFIASSTGSAGLWNSGSIARGEVVFSYDDAFEQSYASGDGLWKLRKDSDSSRLFIEYYADGVTLTESAYKDWVGRTRLCGFGLVDGMGPYMVFLETSGNVAGQWLYYPIRTKNYSYPVSAGAVSSLTAEKPAEVHYPDVAEDGSQVYEVTYQGVTATDIEGIIQGAVDQILAGTAAIAGEVTQAQDVPVQPEAPAASEYAVPGLETIFPFCIPFDIYAFCAALNADPVAPSFEWRMQYAPLDLDYTFVIDLEAFDGAARVLRTMELLAFCVGLAFWTRHLIRG